MSLAYHVVVESTTTTMAQLPSQWDRFNFIIYLIIK